MESLNFWKDIQQIIDEDFTYEGLKKLEYFAQQYDERRLLYKRFSPAEQHGSTKGGVAHVIATILTGAEVATSGYVEGSFPTFKEEIQFATKQIETIKRWSIKQGVWINNIDLFLNDNIGSKIAEGGEATVYDGGSNVIKSIGLDYFIQPIYALDRITLHNTYFPETRLKVVGFGENQGEFKIIVEQPYIIGYPVNELEIKEFLEKIGFNLYNLKNWTYYSPEIYLSDMHDENIVKSKSGTYFILDCDIRINAPFLKTKGERGLTTEIFISNTH